MRILIVDDAKFMRMILRSILEKAGHTIVGEGNNGAVGFKLYKELKPDLVLLDVTMPEVDGIECVRQIKGYDKDAKIIMCSAMGQKSMIMDSISAGATDFIVKPFQADRVLSVIAKVKA